LESAKQLYRWWFGYGSPVTLGVFRTIFCSLIFINFVMVGLFWNDWFGQTGYVPAEIGAKWLDSHYMNGGDRSLLINRIDPLFGVTNELIVKAVYWGTVGFAALSALGLWTRFSTFCLAVGVVAIHHRNPIILHGGDTWMRVVSVYLALGPSGAAVSLDRWLARRRGTAGEQPELISMWPQRLIAYNLALLYFTTTWAKWFGGLWKSGDATWYPARLHEFDKFPVPAFLVDYPMVKITTWGSLAVEFALGTLVFFKSLRKYVLLGGIMLHTWIEYSMNIPLFAFLMMSSYIVFYEGEETAAWWDRLKARFTRS
jgi:hypothetical protein